MSSVHTSLELKAVLLIKSGDAETNITTKMSAKDVERLKEVQEQVISETQRNIDRLNKFLVDYETLKKRLKTLPDRVSYDITVPFGTLAFMPGQLVHTNEILVLLGDDWFVERSSSQAVEIVNRRIQHLKGQIEQLEKQKKLIEPQLGFTSEIEEIVKGTAGIVEIQEPYDEEQEKLWHERRKSLRKASCNRSEGDKQQPKKETVDEQLWKRLEELETKELENDELNQMLDDSESACQIDSGIIGSSTGTDCWQEAEQDLMASSRNNDVVATSSVTSDATGCSQGKRRSVTWENEKLPGDQIEEDDEGSDDSEDADDDVDRANGMDVEKRFSARRRTTINFVHTKVDVIQQGYSREQYCMPSDIKDAPPSTAVARSGDGTPDIFRSSVLKAFTESVVERNVLPPTSCDIPHLTNDSSSGYSSKPATDSALFSSAATTTNRVSKFKASRMQSSANS